MKNIYISILLGVIGVAPFMLGAASSSGGIFKVFAIPALILQYAVNNWDIAIDEVQLSRWAIATQFVGYFFIAFIALKIKDKLIKAT